MGSDSKSNGGCDGDVATGGGGGNSQIPQAAKKVVQNLKEAVNSNCTDSEIYAVLRECDMDPNDAAQRLLSQDTFHEVKSKRERRKELKETQESKTRGTNNTSNRGTRAGNELGGGRSGWAQIGSNEFGKAACGRENGCFIPSASRSTGKVLNGPHSNQSASLNTENRKQPVEAIGSIYSSVVQPSIGFQSSWVGASSGHVSMADIVRMGKSYDKGSQYSSETSEHLHAGVQSSSTPCYSTNSASSTSSHLDMLQQDFQCQSLDVIHQSSKVSGQQGLGNYWPVTEHITANSGPSIVDTSTGKSAIEADMCYNQSHKDTSNLSSNYQSDEIWLPGGDALRDRLTRSVQSSSPQIMKKGARGTSIRDNDCQEGSCRSSKIYSRNHSESSSDDISGTVRSAIVNLQQLSLQKNATKAVSEEDHGVVLPNYLQAFAADCSHLSFGTYKSGKSALTRPLTSSPSTIGLDTSAVTDSLSALHLDSRDPVYQGEKQIGFTYDTHGVIAGARNYGPVKLTPQELEKQEIPEGRDCKQDITLSSVIDPSFESIQHSSSNASSSDLLRNSVYQGENQLGFTYENHGAIVDTSEYMTEQEVEELDNPRGENHEGDVALSSVPTSSFESIQQLSTPASFVINPSARNVPPMLTEMARISGNFSISELSSHVLPGTTLATEPAFQHSLKMNSFSQNGYSTMLQSNLHTPSALHQAYADGNMFHESLLASKYRYPSHQSGAASNNGQFSSSYPPGYQGYGNSNDATRRFLQNVTPALPGTQVGYDDILGNQLKDNFNVLQPNVLTDRWSYVHDSRNLSSVPDAAYYSLLGQSQQISRYHQVQQLPLQQQYNSLGYASFHDSHRGFIQEPQQPSFSNLTLASPRESSSEQLPQIWQHRH